MFLLPLLRRKKKVVVLVIAAFSIILVYFYKIPTSNTIDRSLQSTINVIENEKELVECPIYQIPSRSSIDTTKLFQETVNCQHHQPSKSSCSFVQNFYKYDFDTWKCGNDASASEALKICWYLPKRQQYKCDSSQCGKHEHVHVHRFDSTHGRLTTKKMNSNRETLSWRITAYAMVSLGMGFPFFYLSCGGDVKRMQLLVLDPSMLSKPIDVDEINQNKMNINLLFIDSLSRAHFHRSLKKTVSYLGWLNSESNIAEVLDFEMFQSIHGHTTENILGLMTGKIFPKGITDAVKEKSPTKFPEMLKFVKGHGYETLYQENMCWEGSFGLNLELGLLSEWKDFYKRLKEESYIDDTGTSLLNVIRINNAKNKMKTGRSGEVYIYFK